MEASRSANGAGHAGIVKVQAVCLADECSVYLATATSVDDAPVLDTDQPPETRRTGLRHHERRARVVQRENTV